nr:glycoside hydrolase family 9 protein [Planctomycetota bacterium]
MRYLSLILLTCCLSAAEGQPEVLAVQCVAPDVLAVVIDSQARQGFAQEPYTPQAGDEVEAWSEHQRFLKRTGSAIGILICGDTMLKPFDRHLGEPLSADATVPDRWQLSAPGQAPLTPVVIHRKSKPTATARLGTWRFGYPQHHVLYLRFDHQFVAGTTYQLKATGLNLDRSSISYRHQPDQARSEAIHVNHLGFAPKDPAKVAYISLWMGTGGGHDYGPSLNCELINEHDEVVHSATVAITHPATQPDAGREKANNVGADVYRYRFDAVTTPGTYRVRVQGIGCSTPFQIADTAYDAAYITASRGLYHLRSGIALEQPFTSWTRPRCFHPDDGVVINATTVRSADGLNQGEVFKALPAHRTGATRSDAWGGYFDAGDWDRRTSHLSASMRQLELFSMLPEAFASDTELNLPESGNGIPDIIDEVRWNLDCYRRMQEPGGGIPHGIESAEH